MLCPNCGNPDVIVRSSRVVDGDRQRHRGCGKCNARWQTHEVMVDGTLDVPKPEPVWWGSARAGKRLGLTQQQIAEKCGVTQASVGRALKPTLRRKRAEYQRDFQAGTEARAVRSLKRPSRAKEARA